MNADTVTLIERPYQEVVDDILTAMVGGVVNEPIVFDVKEDHFPLSRVASDVRGITGTVSVQDARCPTPSRGHRLRVRRVLDERSAIEAMY